MTDTDDLARARELLSKMTATDIALNDPASDIVDFAVNLARFAFSEEGFAALAEKIARTTHGGGPLAGDVHSARAILALLASAGLSTGEGK